MLAVPRFGTIKQHLRTLRSSSFRANRSIGPSSLEHRGFNPVDIEELTDAGYLIREIHEIGH